LIPANADVIHKNVLAYTSSVAAATFRRVQRLRQPRFPGRSLALAAGTFTCTLLLDRIAPHLTSPTVTPSFDPSYGLGQTQR
jgi:hypothetical protein